MKPTANKSQLIFNSDTVLHTLYYIRSATRHGQLQTTLNISLKEKSINSNMSVEEEHEANNTSLQTETSGWGCDVLFTKTNLQLLKL